MILLYNEILNIFKIQYSNEFDYEIIGTNKDYDFYKDFIMQVCKIDDINLTKVKNEYNEYCKMQNKTT